MARAAPAPRAPEPEPTIHDELFAAAVGHDVDFAPKGAKEPVQIYLNRLHEVIKVVDSWDELTEGAQQWYNDSLDARSKKQPYLVPDGLSSVMMTVAAPRKARNLAVVAVPEPDPEPEEVAATEADATDDTSELENDPEPEPVEDDIEPEPEPAPAPRAARKAVAAPAKPAVAKAPAKAVAAPEPAPVSRKTAAPQAAAPAKAPAKAAAKPAPVQTSNSNGGESAIGELRNFLLQNNDVSFDEMMAHLTSVGVTLNPSTARTARYWVLSTIRAAKEFGHWRVTPAAGAPRR